MSLDTQEATNVKFSVTKPHETGKDLCDIHVIGFAPPANYFSRHLLRCEDLDARKLAGELYSYFMASAPSLIPSHVAMDMEDAACLWEAVLEFRRGDARKPLIKDLMATFDANGAVQVRSCVVAHTELCKRDFNAAQAMGFDSPFDWEFCPLFVEHALSWNYDGKGELPTYIEGWMDMFINNGGSFKDVL